MPHLHESLGVRSVCTLLIGQQELAAPQMLQRHELLASLEPALDEAALRGGLHSRELVDL